MILTTLTHLESFSLFILKQKNGRVPKGRSVAGFFHSLKFRFWIKCESPLSISSSFLSPLLSFENLRDTWFTCCPTRPTSPHTLDQITHWRCIRQPSPLLPICAEMFWEHRLPERAKQWLPTWGETSAWKPALSGLRAWGSVGCRAAHCLLLVWYQGCFLWGVRQPCSSRSDCPLFRGPLLVIWGQLLIGSSGHPKFSWFQCRFFFLFLLGVEGERQEWCHLFFLCLKKQGPAVSQHTNALDLI